MKRLYFNIIAVFALLFYAVILLLGNVYHVSIPIATVQGSYAEQYARDNHIEQVEIPDSEKDIFDIRYETFDYNINEYGYICLERYNGLSDELVVPAFIGDTMVTELGKDFFNGASFSKIYLPISITSIDGDPGNSIEIVCDVNSLYYQEHKDDKNVRLSKYYDSDAIDFLCGDIPFAYNENNNEIELTAYLGNDDIIAIPSYIDGKPVRIVSFDMLGEFRFVSFPDTVNNIKGKIGGWFADPVFIIEFTFTIFAFVIVILINNVVIPRFKKGPNEYLVTETQMRISFTYLFIQILFSIFAIYILKLDWIIDLVISIVLMLVYVVVIFMLGAERKHIQEINKKNQDQKQTITDLKKMVIGLDDGIMDAETKKAVRRVIEEIQYSQNLSVDIENEQRIMEQIENLRNLIDNGSNDAVQEESKKIIKMMRTR